MALDAFDIYTVAGGIFLEKIFNAIRLILGDGGFITGIKTTAIASLAIVAAKWSSGGNLKEAYKYMATVVFIMALVMSNTATVRIHDKLRNAYGGLPAVRVVHKAPWGLVFWGSVTSGFGNFVSEKFEQAFSAVFANPTYGKTGMLFGSKLVEDINSIKMRDPQIMQLVSTFCAKCIYPDAKMGYLRKNGYTVRDLAETDDILEFLKDRSSRVRRMYFSGVVKKYKSGNSFVQSSVETEKISEYVTCNKAAHYLSDMIDYDTRNRIPKLASSFFSVFFPNQGKMNKNAMFEGVLRDSYGIFVKSSRSAQDTLKQSVMINALEQAISVSSSYGQIATDKLTQSAYHSMGHAAQKWVPLFLGVFEALVYAIFPIVVVLLFLPNGIQYLKNYGRSFIYLQLWQPTFIIIYCFAGYWTQFQGVDSLTYINHSKISRASADMSAIAGYMLFLVPVLAGMILSGLGSSLGNLATSMFHVPQTAALQAADSAVKGNYNFGNTQMGNHSYNNESANKTDDNQELRTGLKKWVTGNNVDVTQSPTGENIFKINSNQLSGLGEADFTKAVGTSLNKAKSKAQHEKESWGARTVESTSAGLSKLFGHDKATSLNTHAGTNWSDGLGGSERKAYHTIEKASHGLSKKWGLTKDTAYKFLMAASVGAGTPKGLPVHAGFNAAANRSKGSVEQNVYDDALNLVKDNDISKSVDTLSQFARSDNFSTQTGLNENAVNSIKDDFSKGYNASLNYDKATDQLKTIQQQESSWNTSQQNIRSSLNHHFGKWGEQNFGISGFAQKLKANPESAFKLVDKFMQKEVLPNNPSFAINKVDYVPKSMEVVKTQYKDLHQQNDEKANTYVNETASNEAKNPDSKLNDAQRNMNRGSGLAAYVGRQVKVQGKQVIEKVKNKTRGNEKEITKQGDRLEDRRDKLEDKQSFRFGDYGDAIIHKIKRDVKKKLTRGTRDAKDMLNEWTSPSPKEAADQTVKRILNPKLPTKNKEEV